MMAGVLGPAASLAACGGGNAPQKPSVTACTAAYPAWFKASALAGKTTATPAACAGLSQDQVTAISVKYLTGHAATSATVAPAAARQRVPTSPTARKVLHGRTRHGRTGEPGMKNNSGAPVVITRKYKRTHWFWHAVTFGLTGGMSAPLNAAVAVHNASYNSGTRKLAASPDPGTLAARAAAAGRSVASQRAREHAERVRASRP
jgi:hypothetical protein